MEQEDVAGFELGGDLREVRIGDDPEKRSVGVQHLGLP
jgi:hypothetical protein